MRKSMITAAIFLAASAALGAEKVTSLNIATKGDNSAYNKTELKVKAGSKCTLTFTNKAKAEGMNHNWVLTKPGTEAQVATDGIAAGEANNWQKPGDTNVIAATKLIGPGKKDSVTFIAPPAGDYPFICTFPGHNSTMHGVLHSK